jgi:hypothetical protein
VPAIKKAAEVKQAEDMAKQKIKAIKYLAKIGCGCYDQDDGITDALLAALEDCTEKVRLAAVEAIAELAAGEACSNCKQKSCCSERIIEMLAKLAYECDEQGCWYEPSGRVRAKAAEAFQNCCPDCCFAPAAPALPEPQNIPSPIEGDSSPPIEGAEEVPDDALAMPLSLRQTTDTSPPIEEPRKTPRPIDAYQIKLDPVDSEDSPSSAAPVAEPDPHVSGATVSQAQTVATLVRGRVSKIDYDAGQVHIMVDHGLSVLEGTRFKMYHRRLLGWSCVGEVQVVASAPGVAVAQPISGFALQDISRGDFAETLTTHWGN